MRLSNLANMHKNVFTFSIVALGGACCWGGSPVDDSGLNGKVRVQLNAPPPEGENSWLDHTLLSYEQSTFAFARIPQAYTENGTRDEWPNPLQVVAEADISIPKGTHEILLRSRRGARLWIDGRLIAENPFPPFTTDGFDPVERTLLNLGEEVRILGPGDQEKLVAWESDGARKRVRLEFYVGGYRGKRVMRPETGETLVALSLEGESSFRVIGPDASFPLTDLAWEAFYEDQMSFLDNYDRGRRRELRTVENEYWEKRHEFARETVLGRKDSATGSLDQSIDSLVESKIAAANRAIDASEEARFFIEEVRPLLEDKCWDCHGKSGKGGLRLDARESAMEGGESDIAALVPGDPGLSYLLELVSDEDPEFRMPPKGEALSRKEIDSLATWIGNGAVWPETTITREIAYAPLSEDWQFIRRLYLDTVGVVPTAQEVEAFLEDRSEGKRSRLIDELLDDPRWADHWVSYWQDVLAENPTIVNPTLNNTGPFRFWIHEAFEDNLPVDRFVTDLVLMDGSLYGGGPAGFEMASQNDVPMAAKANILSTAFLGIEMKCSRCHDAPFHDNRQEDLFGMAAMLAQEPLVVPASSSVPMDALHAGGRKPLIQVTLPPGSTVEPHWPFGEELESSGAEEWLRDPESSRERLAFHLTSPANGRFAKVVANRLWQRLFGRGIVESVSDWENASPLHPELLEYLSDHLVLSGYDLKSLARLVLNSRAYQRQISDDSLAVEYFAAQGPRQMSAEQIVDSLFAATGTEMRTETLTVDIGGGRAWSSAMSLGQPKRAWMFGGLANNRDRPSLMLPRAQAVVDVMKAFGWRASRQEPVSERVSPLSPLQPAILNNGTMSGWLSRLSDDHGLTELAIGTDSPDALVDALYLRILGRYPNGEEDRVAVSHLKAGFEKRVIKSSPDRIAPRNANPELFVTWANHVDPKANELALAAAADAKKGDPPTERLEANWRERMEDMVWSLINMPEAVHYP